MEKVKSKVPNEDDGIYDGLVNLVNLDELIDNNIKTDGADYTADQFFALDDLDVDLGEFYAD